ncbi:MAG: hypothetical protein KIS78_12885, partial [Labilithrix sp.]|nr:hypothetical protein [Labilithrix sp.]
MAQHPPPPMYPPTGQPPMGYPPAAMPSPPAPPSAPKDDGEKKGWMNWELFIDKTVDFILIFVGLYAATALQRYQDDQKEKDEYVLLLNDFKHELEANRAQHGTIEQDLGPADHQASGVVLGPMEATFSRFIKDLDADEDLVHCLHRDYAKAKGKAKAARSDPRCAQLYAAFEKEAAEHASGKSTSFKFEPATLSPFYRYEVWQLYLANSAKIFKNKELAVKIGEAYNNMHVIEKQVADIETTYNDAFMRQVGRAAATDAELTEIIHDEETDHDLSAQDLALLLHIAESMKEERFGTLEAKSVLELKVRRMKRTVQETNKEIDALVAQIEAEAHKVS